MIMIWICSEKIGANKINKTDWADSSRNEGRSSNYNNRNQKGIIVLALFTIHFFLSFCISECSHPFSHDKSFSLQIKTTFQGTSRRDVTFLRRAEEGALPMNRC